jgi:spectinomycin phosphotransferase
LERALGTAVALVREPRLDFVVAPLPTIDNAVVRPFGSRHAVSVYPFLTGQSYPFGPHADPARRAQVLNMLIALHGATAAVRRMAPPHHPRVGRRHDLDIALQEPDRPWGPGPLSEAARALIASHATELAELLQGFDRLAQAIHAPGVERVITHGEPHPANVMSVGGRLVLLDWDTVAVAPPERDLWLVAPDSGDEIARYQEATGRRVDPAALTLYRLRWDLDDIASAVGLFRTTHSRTEDSCRGWEGLIRQIGRIRSWQSALA